jgi:D-alanine transaminase
MTIVYLNGEYLPLDQAKISVMDRGFLFGDGVYEVIPAYGRRLLRLEEHLRRLQFSLDSIHLKNPLNHAQWLDILNQVLAHNSGDDQSVYVHVSRGVAAKRDHAFPAQVQPTIFIMSSPLPSVARADLQRGISVVTLDDIRWQACNIKATALLANVLLRQQAVEAGANEAILVRDGFVTEGAASNIFVLSKGVLVTPPKSRKILTGITRDLVLELAQAHAIAAEEREIAESELNTAEEIWVTSSLREIAPVLKLNNKPVGKGKPGQLWERMIDIYKDYVQRLRRGDAT